MDEVKEKTVETAEEKDEEDEVEFEECIGEPDEPLDEARKKNFQTQAARANYVCMDRADLGCAHFGFLAMEWTALYFLLVVVR